MAEDEDGQEEVGQPGRDCEEKKKEEVADGTRGRQQAGQRDWEMGMPNNRRTHLPHLPVNAIPPPISGSAEVPGLTATLCSDSRYLQAPGRVVQDGILRGLAGVVGQLAWSGRTGMGWDDALEMSGCPGISAASGTQAPYPRRLSSLAPGRST